MFCEADTQAPPAGAEYHRGVDLPASLAPPLAEASTKAYVLLDGTLLPIDRIATDQPFS